MATFFDPTYDPQKDSASSAVDVSDLNPEQKRDVDLRRLDEEERDRFSDRLKTFGYERKFDALGRGSTDQEDAQNRIGKFMRAAKTAGAYKTRAGIAEPTLRGKTPRNSAIIDVSSFGTPFGGTVLPSMGDTAGRAGSTNYADKPLPKFGTFYGFN
jgi:hypothetical protein